ncbi:unnamed protein product [Boreogadus saida]
MELSSEIKACGAAQPAVTLWLCGPEIENLLEQLKDKDKQLAGLRERVKGLQTDSSNTDTALATLEEALSEKVEGQPAV